MLVVGEEACSENSTTTGVGVDEEEAFSILSGAMLRIHGSHTCVQLARCAKTTMAMSHPEVLSL